LIRRYTVPGTRGFEGNTHKWVSVQRLVIDLMNVSLLSWHRCVWWLCTIIVWHSAFIALGLSVSRLVKFIIACAYYYCAETIPHWCRMWWRLFVL